MSLDKEKLIVLRGPSGAGKSTIAKRILRETKRDVVVLEQDLYRKAITHVSNSFKLRQEMVKQDCLLALEHGYDVILDGIFNIKRHDVLFDEIVKVHPNNNYFFYFDVPFDETVRRHQTRDKIKEFGEASMRDWYGAATPSGYVNEIILPADMNEDGILETINTETGIIG